MTVQDLFWRVKKNPLVRGVTFSGGEPFSQAEPFTELAKLLKANGYEVASYTGYTFEELLENGTPAQKQLLAALDILVDGEFVLAQRNLDLRFRGSENQRILDVPQSLAQGRAVWCTACLLYTSALPVNEAEAEGSLRYLYRVRELPADASEIF